MVVPDPFSRLQQEYQRLRGLLASRQITSAQFEAEMQRLMVQDTLGRYWTIGKDDGRWYVSNGQVWVEANPYPSPVAPAGPPPVYAAAAPKKKGPGCGLWLGCGCLGMLLLLVILGGGGYFAYRQGWLTLTTVLNLVGMGPGYVEVNNLRDEAVFVTITRIDQAEPSILFSGAALNSFDFATYPVSDPGRYQVNFGTASAGADLGACTLTVKAGDRFQFVPLPDSLLISWENHPPATGADLLAATSRLCR